MLCEDLVGEYLLPQTKAEEGYVLVANTVQRVPRAIYEPDKAKELRRTSLGQTLVISRRSQLEEAKVDKASESVQNLGGLVGSPKRWALASIRHRQKGSIIRVAARVPAYEDFKRKEGPKDTDRQARSSGEVRTTFYSCYRGKLQLEALGNESSGGYYFTSLTSETEKKKKGAEQLRRLGDGAKRHYLHYFFSSQTSRDWISDQRVELML
ncbi:hypothetical protein JHK85_048231 [Glycine max]|nr:hypothetical protein JHK85_048231 [Glycine max]